MQSPLRPWTLWAAAVLSAALLELPFPLAGPLPVWRAGFAWIGLVPLLWAVLHPTDKDPAVRPPIRWSAPGTRPLRRGFLLGYLCGVLWYMGNCYWIYATMHVYGGLPPVVSVLLLAGFSLVLGLYFGLFAWGVALVRQKTGSGHVALAVAPFLWTGLDLAAARITSVPWDQLGYSQIDNQVLLRIVPWTGVYGITCLIVAVSALLAEELLYGQKRKYDFVNRPAWRIFLVVLVVGLTALAYAPPRNPSPTDSAVLVQPNLDVGSNSGWNGAAWDQHMAQFAQLAAEPAQKDTTYILGIPQTGAPLGEMVPPPYPTYPDLVVWPESPAPFFQNDPRLTKSLQAIALQDHSPLIIGGIGLEPGGPGQDWRYYNSAMVFDAGGRMIGRYDKIHLVPFGEYIPFADLLQFAHKLTGRVGSFSRGTEREVFLLNGPGAQPHRYGVFICYESVFADEVREFAKRGAQVLVNISDDGWYGDTSAPWQHLNMARMRAVENGRWLLRDTNTGVTAVIDPYGRVRQSIPRHQVGELPAEFAFVSQITFYSAHGDVFAWVCVLLSLGIVAWAAGLTSAPAGRLSKLTK